LHTSRSPSAEKHVHLQLGNEDANDEGTVIDAESEVNLLNMFIGVRVPSTLYSFLLGITFAMYDTCVRAVEGGAA